jgi:hypothetical protein
METAMISDADELVLEDGSCEEPELTVQEYARLCGLCTDYLTENPIDLFASIARPETATQDLEDLEGAKLVDVSVEELIKERLEVCAEARELLYLVVKEEENPFPYVLPEPEIRVRSTDLKLELPLLETDNELDVLHFGHRPVPDFKNMNMPMEHTDRERDEGMEWPTRYLKLPQRYERQYASEKLEFPRDGAEFLMDVVKDPWDSKDMVAVTSEFTYIKVRLSHTIDLKTKGNKADNPSDRTKLLNPSHHHCFRSAHQ